MAFGIRWYPGTEVAAMADDDEHYVYAIAL
jgi:hypothetical protein